MPVETLKINWRDQFDVLEPYLDGQGGVLVVRYPDADRCAPNAFVQALTSQYASGDKPGWRVSVRLDPHDYNTRFLAGIRETLRLKLGFAEQPVAAPALGGQFGSNNDSGGGAMDISLTIHQHGSDAAQVRELTNWRGAFLKDLEAFLLSGRRVMIILGEDEERSHRAFWRDIWSPGMARLTTRGLCVVSLVCDQSGRPGFAPDAPRPEQIIDLPAGYGASETGHAIEDVTAIFETEAGIDRTSAEAAAKTLVWGHQQNVGALHGAVPGMVLKWSGRR